ncbi:MAG: bacterial proteasome activator family protein [Acidimicrobiales bacterium]
MSDVPPFDGHTASPGSEEASSSAASVDGAERPHEIPEVVDNDDEGEEMSTIAEPAKVMRIGSMIKQLLEEVRTTDLDEAGRHRLREIYETSVSQLSDALSPDLSDELQSLATPFSDDVVPSEGELRIAQAQLVGWLEGLFHGIQATLFAQQMAARQQLEQMKHSQALPPSRPDGPASGVYL